MIFKTGQRVRIDTIPYQVSRSAKGGMGQVVFCDRLDLKDNDITYRPKLAVKVFTPDNDVNQVKAELRNWHKLNHINIARLKRIGYIDDWVGALMTWYLDGQITAELIERNGGLTELSRALSQCINALEYAYAQHQTLHLDIKPANILQLGEIYGVADWGISRLVHNKAQRRSPASSGTIPYMAPERFGDAPAAITADVYSIGITCYELIFNELPTQGCTVEEVVLDIVSGRSYMRLSSALAVLERKWQTFILAACHPIASKRPATYAELRSILPKER